MQNSVEKIVVCFPNCLFISETSRMVAIYRELLKLGVSAKMVTHGGTYEFVLKNEGITYELIEPVVTKEELKKFLMAVTKPWHKLYNKSTLLKFVKSEIELFKTYNAGAVITGFQLSTALSARSVKIPLIVTHLGSLVPPVFERDMLDLSETFNTRLIHLIPSKKINRLAIKLFQSLPFQKRIFNKVAKDLHIEPIRSTLDLLMGDLTMITDVPEILGIPENEIEAWRPVDSKYYRPTSRLKYAGAIFAQLFGNIPEEVISFLKTDKPKIYVAMASGEKKNMQIVYDTLLTMNVRVVFCSLTYDHTFYSTENILVINYLPSHLVMPLCDLAIIHGGQGSVQTAISAGVPIIGFPIQPEQYFNLKQVEKFGAGKCIFIKDLIQKSLSVSIKNILENGQYKKSMKMLQDWQSSRNGASEVAKAVSNLLYKVI